MLAAILLGGPRLWLRTSHGHRTVERVLTQLLNHRVPGSVTVGALEGGLLTGLTARDVVVRNPAGAVIGQAQRISARWRPLRLLGRRELEEVRVDEPLLALDRARWLPSRAGRRSKDTFIHLITAHDGRVSWKGTVFSSASGTAVLHTSSHLEVQKVSAHIVGSSLTAFGTVGWKGRPAWVDIHFAVENPGALQGHGQLTYESKHLQVDLEDLEVVAPLVTPLIGGRGPLSVLGRVELSHGTLSGNFIARQAKRQLHLRASIRSRAAYRQDRGTSRRDAASDRGDCAGARTFGRGSPCRRCTRSSATATSTAAAR